jgi:hypothetical protein
MALVLIEWEYHYNLLECPAFVAENIAEYQRKFDVWMGDKSNNHGYWVKHEPKEYFAERGFSDPYEGMRDPDGKDGLAYDESAFADWLNRFVLQDTPDKAKIISQIKITERDEKGHAIIPEADGLPHIWF